MLSLARRRLIHSRLFRRIHVDKRRRRTARLANEVGALDLTLVPAPHAGGRPDRYYHFIFDLLLPLSKLVRSLRPGGVLGVPEVGPFSAVVRDLYGDAVRVGGVDSEARGEVVGMTPTHVYLSRRDARAFVDDVFERADIPRAARADNVLLIERMPPSDYYRTSDHRPGGGASRRSILNHAEVAAALRSRTQAPYAFHSVRLEEVGFEEQLRLFDSAAVVIGQHGAGLSNALWMRPGSVVLELDHEARPHFERVSALRGHRHARYDVDGPHATVDPERFARWAAAQCRAFGDAS